MGAKLADGLEKSVFLYQLSLSLLVPGVAAASTDLVPMSSFLQRAWQMQLVYEVGPQPKTVPRFSVRREARTTSRHDDGLLRSACLLCLLSLLACFLCLLALLAYQLRQRAERGPKR